MFDLSKLLKSAFRFGVNQPRKQYIAISFSVTNNFACEKQATLSELFLENSRLEEFSNSLKLIISHVELISAGQMDKL